MGRWFREQLEKQLTVSALQLTARKATKKEQKVYAGGKR